MDIEAPIMIGWVINVALLWILLFVLLGKASGWAALAQTYRYWGPLPAERHRLITGFVVAMSYKSLDVAVRPEGLYLSKTWAFRPGHPPLLIPWSAVAAVYQRQMGDHMTRLVLRDANAPSLILPTQVLEGAFRWLPPVQPGDTRGRIGWRVIAVFVGLIIVEAPWLWLFFSRVWFPLSPFR